MDKGGRGVPRPHTGLTEHDKGACLMVMQLHVTIQRVTDAKSHNKE